MFTKRQFLKLGVTATGGLVLPWRLISKALADAIPGGSLSPEDIPKYVTPLVKPPAMPRSSRISARAAKNTDYYEIAVRQFEQQVLPPGLPGTTVWSYGAVEYPGTVLEGGTFNYPAFTIEARWRRQTRVKWINGLVDASGNYLPHLLPVDQTLHWANPPGPRDERGTSQDPYAGPVPMVVHVHGARAEEHSDGFAEAWYLPNAGNIPAGYARTGSFYHYFRQKYGFNWSPGSATFSYANNQNAATLWYHDHTLGMTRLNVYAGPAGFYLLRGGDADLVQGVLPGPAPGFFDNPFGTFYEIPIAIQDRSFDANGALFYPDNRAFFEALQVAQLQIPFTPDEACDGLASDVPPIWNPEFFGNAMVVNGATWPYLTVEPRRYRLRLLNGCNSRFLILKLSNGMPFVQIGAEGGFLPQPVQLTQLLMAPAERADVIVDFTRVPVGTEIILQNLGPDEPFGGGVPGVDFEPADPDSTGQVMQFRVVHSRGRDASTPAMDLVLPPLAALGAPSVVRELSLNEEDSQSVRVSEDGDGNIVLDCGGGEEFGPAAALLGTVSNGEGEPLMWDDAITENPALGATEEWRIYNFTADAHPIHIHEVPFQVLGRGPDGNQPPEPWETGLKDTVIAYPGEITRVKAKFERRGFYVWHCHIVEHEDNEMMRPYHVGPIPDDAP